MSITIEQLKPFCSSDENRPALNAPFERNGNTYATDGRILVRVDGLISDCPSTHEKAPKLEPNIYAFPPADAEMLAFSISDLGPEPPLEECENCGGSGRYLCPHCNHESTCDDCDGFGQVRETEKPFKVDDQYYNPWYLRKAAELPGFRWVKWRGSIVAGCDKPPGGFLFDGGAGLLMSMRVNEDGVIHKLTR